MPNYSLVIGSKFRPFSYQEMLAPVLQQTQAHQQVEESYATLAAEADQWKNIAMSEPNSKAAETYMQYARDLESQADMLATKGLSLNSRRDAFKMAQRYQSEMLPIQQAYTTKMKDIEAQRAAGPDAVFSYDANNRSIDEYIANPMTTYETLDLNKAFTAAATDIGQIKGALTDLQKNGRLDAFHKYYAQVKGLTPEEAALTSKAMETGDWSGVDMSKPQNQFVYNAMNRVYSMYTQPWMNSDQDQKLKDYIARGAAYGIGTTDIHAYEDFLAKENYKAEKAKQQQAGLNQVLDPKGRTLTQDKEQNKLQKKINRYKELREYIRKHPQSFNEKIPDYSYKSSGIESEGVSMASLEQASKVDYDAVQRQSLISEYKKLEQEIKSILKQNGSTLNYGNTSVVQKDGKWVMTVPSDKMINDFDKLAEIETGYTLRLGDAAQKQVMNQLRRNLSSDEKRSDYVQNITRGRQTQMTKNNWLEGYKDEDWNNATVDIVGGKTRLHIGNDTYLLKPGAFGSVIDETDLGDGITRESLEALYKAGRYDEYTYYLNKWANGLYGWATTVMPGSSNTSDKIATILSLMQ